MITEGECEIEWRVDFEDYDDSERERIKQELQSQLKGSIEIYETEPLGGGEFAALIIILELVKGTAAIITIASVLSDNESESRVQIEVPESADIDWEKLEEKNSEYEDVNITKVKRTEE